MWDLLRAFIFGFGAIYFCSFVFRAPKRTRIATGLIGAVCYTGYAALGDAGAPVIVSYFTATFVMAVLCELCAVWLKAPATIFISTAVLALVPGLDLYRTMRFFTFGEYSAGSQTGLSTLMVIGTMAMALALGFFAVKSVRRTCAALTRRRRTLPKQNKGDN